MQPCWCPGCDFDGITEIYNAQVDRMYPVCYKHLRSGLNVKQEMVVNEA